MTPSYADIGMRQAGGPWRLEHVLALGYAGRTDTSGHVGPAAGPGITTLRTHVAGMPVHCTTTDGR